jgi:tetratricopeptide (TPR) repeat protein
VEEVDLSQRVLLGVGKPKLPPDFAGSSETHLEERYNSSESISREEIPDKFFRAKISMNVSALAGLLFLTISSTPLAIAQSTPDAADNISDLDPGIVRHALALGHSDIAEHPKDAAAYIRLAYSLTDAGINDEAVEVARKATQADPDSAVGYSGLAWVLSHNSIGVMFGNLGDAAAARSRT